MIKIEDYTELLYKLVLKSYKNNEIPVGSIVIYDNKVIGKGYNTRQKTNYVCGHAEVNAILNSSSNLNGATLYVSLFPCNECAKVIIQSGIKHIVYMDDKYNGTDGDIASKKMLDAAGISYKKIDKIKVSIEDEERA